jgi:hypothetical protein
MGCRTKLVVKKMKLKPIKNKTQLKQALTRIDELWGATRNTEKGDELDVLMLLVEKYEEEHYPIPPSDPIIDNDFIGKLVYLEWVDTVASAGWETKDTVNTKLVKQVGWVVQNDDTTVKIASTFSEEEYYSVTAIPIGCLVSMRPVVE